MIKDDLKKQLIDKAFEAMENSYSPYSKFRVGACLVNDKGVFYKGTNVENISFGLTNCAERSAIFSAFTDGNRKENIVAMAIVTEDDTLTTPCGACRQVLSELVNPDMPIILSNRKEEMVTDIRELLPFMFETENL